MLLLSIGAKAESLPTTDYVYTTGLQWDNEEKMYCFDVMLQGDNLYTAYGMDILIPQGWQVSVTSIGKPNIVMVDDYCTEIDNVIYPYEEGRRGYTYFHDVTPNFPEKEKLCHIRVACLSTDLLYLTSTSGPLFRVYLEKTIEDGQWPIGSVKFYNVELNKVGQPYDSADREDIVLIHTGETNLPLSVSATAHWGTCILPFNAELPAGVKAYTCTENDGENIYLENASSMEAYTPYILYSEDGYKGTISGTVDAQKYPETGYVKKGLLNGAIVDQSISDGYILQNLSGGVMFYPIKEGSTFNIPAGKCWMTLPSTANAQGMNFVVNDPASIKNIGITDDDNSIYTLQGIKVENGVKGSIYIKSGKKFIAK